MPLDENELHNVKCLLHKTYTDLDINASQARISLRKRRRNQETHFQDGCHYVKQIGILQIRLDAYRDLLDAIGLATIVDEVGNPYGWGDGYAVHEDIQS